MKIQKKPVNRKFFSNTNEHYKHFYINNVKTIRKECQLPLLGGNWHQKIDRYLS